MIPLDSMKLLVQQRLHVAAEEIFFLVERFLNEYNNEDTHCRQQALLDVTLHTTDESVESSSLQQETSPVPPEQHAGLTKRQWPLPQRFQDFELASMKAIDGATDQPHGAPAQPALTSASIKSSSDQCVESRLEVKTQAQTPEPACVYVKKEEPEDHPDISVKEEAEDLEREGNAIGDGYYCPPSVSRKAIDGATDQPHGDLAPLSPPEQAVSNNSSSASMEAIDGATDLASPRYTSSQICFRNVWEGEQVPPRYIQDGCCQATTDQPHGDLAPLSPPAQPVSNNSSSESDSEEEEEEEEKKERRHADISENDLEELERSRYEAGTFKQTKWSVRCFQTWCAEKELAIDFKTVTKVELNQTLRQFYASVKNGKGKPYSFSSYVGLRAGLNRHINDPPISRSMCLLKDPEFITSNTIFVAVVKRLRREGLHSAFHHRALTEADFEKIARSRALDPSTPEGLVNKVWFDVQLHMGRRAKEGNNRHLKAESFSFHRDASDGRKCVTLALREHPRTHRDADETDAHCLRGFMREQPGNPLCPVASLEKYLSLLPNDPPAFYLHPIRAPNVTKDLWYTREPMGINFLASMLPRICKAAGTETIYTNTCLQKTPVPKCVSLVPIASDAASLVPKPAASISSRPNHPQDSSRRRNILPKTPLKRTPSTESSPPVPEKRSANRTEKC